MMNENSSDEDEVIEEIPVYISKTLSDQLYIFQYPNKNSEFNSANAEVLKSCTFRYNKVGCESFENKEHFLATGSYDENLRFFDTRSFKQPLSTINLNGGIWRIKMDPFVKEILLCACMYYNFSIVKIDGADEKPELVGEYFEHKSICCGSDWCRKLYNDQMIMATCSFYDQKLCISSVKN